MTVLRRTVFLARRPQEGEHGSAEQPRSARICSVVDPGRVNAGRVQERHSDGRCQGAKERDPQSAPSPKTRRPDTEPEGENRRPDQVELLFDSERPQMLEQRRTSDGLEVRLLAEDQIPVGHVPESSEYIAAQSRYLTGQEDYGESQGDHEQHVERGEEPPRAPQPESLQVDATPLAPLREQERGYQVAANNEEDLDPEEAARDPGQLRVVKEYGDDGERAQAVQARTVTQPYLRGAWRCAGASVRSLAAGLGVGHLRLSQRMFRRFPPSKSRNVILAQYYRTMQDQVDRKVLHPGLFAQRSGPDQPPRSSGRGSWLMSGAPVKLS